MADFLARALAAETLDAFLPKPHKFGSSCWAQITTVPCHPSVSRLGSHRYDYFVSFTLRSYFSYRLRSHLLSFSFVLRRCSPHTEAKHLAGSPVLNLKRCPSVGHAVRRTICRRWRPKMFGAGNVQKNQSMALSRQMLEPETILFRRRQVRLDRVHGEILSTVFITCTHHQRVRYARATRAGVPRGFLIMGGAEQSRRQMRLSFCHNISAPDSEGGALLPGRNTIPCYGAREVDGRAALVWVSFRANWPHWIGRAKGQRCGAGLARHGMPILPRAAVARSRQVARERPFFPFISSIGMGRINFGALSPPGVPADRTRGFAQGHSRQPLNRFPTSSSGGERNVLPILYTSARSRADRGPAWSCTPRRDRQSQAGSDSTPKLGQAKKNDAFCGMLVADRGKALSLRIAKSPR